MRKGKALRLAGFIGATCASVALIATAVETTGAYFSSTKSGTISANGGHLKLNTGNTNLNFADLMPGTNKDQAVNYNVDVTAGNTVDLWLTFDTSTPANKTAYNFFTGGARLANGDYDWHTCVNGDTTLNCGGLGRYGYFAVANTPTNGNSSTLFRSGNLSFATSANTPNTGPATTNECHVNANGDGGSGVTSTGHADFPPSCGVPQAILLASGLNNADSGTVTVTFGLNGPLTGNDKQYVSSLPGGAVHYNLVATQHGQRP